MERDSRQAQLGGAKLTPRERATRELGQAELREVERELFRLIGRLDRGTRESALIANDLDETLLQTGLSPLEPWLLSLRAVVRDAARVAGVQARMEVVAADLRLERSLLTALREPMLHLLRNAVAHGLEAPAARVQAGKPDVGVITVRARALGDRVELRIEDDGRGIDRGALAATIGCRPSELDDPEALLAALTRDGVSTTRRSSALAGRGVGMGAVLDGVEGVGGDLGVHSEAGRGTTFVGRVPRRTTSGSGIIVMAAGATLGVPIQDVERILRLRPEALVVVEQAQCVELDGQLVAVRSIAELLTGDGGDGHGEGLRTALLLRGAGQRLVTLVDEVVGDLPLVIKPLGPQFEGVGLYVGCAVRTDGSPLPVLDVGELFRRARTSRFVAVAASGAASDAAAQTPRAATTRTRQRVLLVEDSMTMRTMERSILQGAGFDVVTASDGQEGWERFVADAAIDLVATDIEMPRMDGIELCRRVRQSERGNVPVVIVTSLGSASDRRQGALAGADAYVTKGDFDERRFLGTIAQVVGSAGEP